MKNIPILMSAPMILAYKAGLKTMTRRVIKPQPFYSFSDGESARNFLDRMEHCKTKIENCIYSGWPHEIISTKQGKRLSSIKCPYGKPGDRLWFKEAWRVQWCLDDVKPSKLPDESIVQYKADTESEAERNCGRWRSSMFMPRRFARFTPKILDIRVERLQDISDEDAIEEGIGRTKIDDEYTAYCAWLKDEKCYSDATGDPREAFSELWDSLNAKPKPVYKNKKIVSYVSYPWEDIRETREHKGKPWEVVGSPWVWVVKFERHQ